MDDEENSTAAPAAIDALGADLASAIFARVFGEATVADLTDGGHVIPLSIQQAQSPARPPRRYLHVSRAIRERAWAVTPSMLELMAEIVDFRQAGGLLTFDEIQQRLADARAQNGDRSIGQLGMLVGNVALIPLYGVISQRTSLMSETSGGTSIEDLRQSFRAAMENPQVGAIVFDVDSPGGSTDGITEFAAELRQARNGAKPIAFVANTLAASAAYWIASQGNELVVTPSGEVGSIGVYAIHEDTSAADQMVGVKTTLISAGKFKTEGNPFEPLTDEARAAMQDQVDAFYAMFLGDVAKGRSATVDAVSANYGQGRTLLAKQALAAGMVDRIDTLEGTVTRLQRPARAAIAPARRPALTSLSAAPAARSKAPSWASRMKEYVK